MDSNSATRSNNEEKEIKSDSISTNSSDHKISSSSNSEVCVLHYENDALDSKYIRSREMLKEKSFVIDKTKAACENLERDVRNNLLNYTRAPEELEREKEKTAKLQAEQNDSSPQLIVSSAIKEITEKYEVAIKQVKILEGDVEHLRVRLDLSKEQTIEMAASKEEKIAQLE
ncbi:hypothetical protein LguiB_032237 [Lonicera macranthoides]